ncbi:UDP-glucose/GDP-mannose dehydrogenase family protein [Bradyrhizobium sp. 138]|uniref:nucleotide sugar dehydrogenase n=1 Tax=Bradyrhizobium sp. 138 TaxID=2782615 RepID=UPI001FF75EF0|nr:nucleotide sugar dehydrogenase [Bradyrhizobium sp. 138]MCK1737096.1 UDP-glucose/GDP-mannose dehydrogenase family protein [Bradyrhizobium sp. 138]
MTVCVYGLWHLGSVTAACLASRGIKTVGLAEDAQAAAKLSAAKAPLFEPGLDAMLAQGLHDGHLSFTSDLAAAIASTDLLWVSFDTPVDNDDVADVRYVLDRIRGTFPHLNDGTVVLISSQVPVGSTAQLERDFAKVAGGRKVSFAYSPENLRLGDAIQVFTKSERIVIGIREDWARQVIEPVLKPFCDTLLWLRVESAEMVKHALNAYLATCVTFTNEVATLCEGVGADMSEVEGALRLDPRIGKKAYVRAGAAFGGGTLARDVQFLKIIAKDVGAQVPVLAAVLESNAYHKGWVVRHLRGQLGALKAKKVGVLGLAYKAGTNAIRRSVAIEVIGELIEAGADITVYDPQVASLPDPLHSLVTIAPSIDAVFVNSEAVVLATEWPEFRELDFGRLVRTMKRALLIDQNAFASKQMSKIAAVNYIIAGKAR